MEVWFELVSPPVSSCHQLHHDIPHGRVQPRLPDHRNQAELDGIERAQAPQSCKDEQAGVRSRLERPFQLPWLSNSQEVMFSHAVGEGVAEHEVAQQARWSIRSIGRIVAWLEQIQLVPAEQGILKRDPLV